MKKITTIIKIMLLAVVVLVLAQGCNPNNQQTVNPTSSLIGKIKKSTLVGFNGDTLEKLFNYDTTTSKLNTINIKSYGQATVFSNYTLSTTYQNNKVLIFLDSVPNTGDIFYLKPSTNLIDSTDYYYNGQFVYRTIIERDINNNILNVTSNMPNTNNAIVSIDSFVYNSNQLISYKTHMPTFLSFSLANNALSYDLSMTKKINADPFCIDKFITNIGAYFYISVDVLGLSFGNSNESIIKTKSYSELQYPFSNENITYDYTTFSSNNIKISFNSDINTKKYLDNIYY